MPEKVFHLRRWKNNPVLVADDIPYRCNTVFNGSVVKIGREYLLLARVEGQQGHSFFALARSKDGYRFNVEDRPAMEPSREEPFRRYEEGGIEDPRITLIDDIYYIMYTASSRYGARIALAKTRDFREYKRIGIVSGPGNKDGVLFSQKINGYYARLDRPMVNKVGSIWISYSRDLINWGDSKILIAPRRGYWDSFRVGASVPPLKTNKGWIEIYHGVKMTSSGPIYYAGILLLDLQDPSKVLARSKFPILSPREEYERIGDVGNVTFACAAVVEPNGEIKLYYGAADTSICVCTGNLEGLLASLA